MASGNTKNFELKLGRTALAIVIVGMAVLLCGTFIFGVAVGKNIDTYPGQIASVPQKLLALVWRPAKIRAAQTAAENKTVQNQPQKTEEPDLTFYKDLTSKKGAVKEQPIPDKKPVVEVPAIKPLLPQPQNDAPVASISPNPVVKKQPAAAGGVARDEIEAKIKEAELAATASSEKFSVQVASLKEKTKANQLNKKVSTLGYKSRIAENDVPGKGKWFRVVIDGFASRANAQMAAEKISGKTGAHCVIRRMSTEVNSN